jgi:hypothetical protein
MEVRVAPHSMNASSVISRLALSIAMFLRGGNGMNALRYVEVECGVEKELLSYMLHTVVFRALRLQSKVAAAYFPVLWIAFTNGWNGAHARKLVEVAYRQVSQKPLSNQRVGVLSVRNAESVSVPKVSALKIANTHFGTSGQIVANCVMAARGKGCAT